MNPPIIAFAGFSGSGKTTFICRLIGRLCEDGKRIAVIKHHHSELKASEFSDRSKDSWRYVDAGAVYSVVVAANVSVAIDAKCGERVVLMEDRTDKDSVIDAISEIPDMDLILVEGFKNEEFEYQIGMSRKENEKGLPHEPSHYTAVVTDEQIDAGSVPVFGLDDIYGIKDLISRNILHDKA